MPIGGSTRVGTGRFNDPNLMSSLIGARFFPQHATFQQKTETRASMGGISYSWANITGYVHLPCAKYDRLPHADRTLEIIEELKYWTFMLGGYYPGVDGAWRLVVDETGEIFSIEGIDSDSTHLYTIVTVRQFLPLAEPGV